MNKEKLPSAKIQTQQNELDSYLFHSESPDDEEEEEFSFNDLM